jgi:5-methylthioadenosine/S-adenosylhomocysteine deaminase
VLAGWLAGQRPSQVYATTRDQVTDVWVAGKRLLSERKLTTIDEDALLAKAREWQDKVSTA